jgi:hypothetical protein
MQMSAGRELRKEAAFWTHWTDWSGAFAKANDLVVLRTAETEGGGILTSAS